MDAASDLVNDQANITQSSSVSISSSCGIYLCVFAYLCFFYKIDEISCILNVGLLFCAIGSSNVSTKEDIFSVRQ